MGGTVPGIVGLSATLARLMAEMITGGTTKIKPIIMRVSKENTSWVMNPDSSITPNKAISATPLPINPDAMAKGVVNLAMTTPAMAPASFPKIATRITAATVSADN